MYGSVVKGLEEEILFYGAGMKNEDIEKEFKELYQQLLHYSESICNVVEKIAAGSKDHRRIALDLAETDGRFLVQLVIKECDKRGWRARAQGRQDNAAPR